MIIIAYKRDVDIICDISMINCDDIILSDGQIDLCYKSYIAFVD